MAFGKTSAAGLILALQLGAAQFPMRHEHLRKSCTGILTVDDKGIRFAGPKGHDWAWSFQDIQQLTLLPMGLHILTYKDSKLRLGADVEFRFTGELPADELYRDWSARLDQRLVVARAYAGDGDRIPAKHLGTITGSEGALVFAPESIVFDAARDARTWRYSDIQNISSSGPFELTITTFEKQFHFQLKQPLTEARYNQLWLDIERKNGKLQ